MTDTNLLDLPVGTKIMVAGEMLTVGGPFHELCKRSFGALAVEELGNYVYPDEIEEVFLTEEAPKAPNATVVMEFNIAAAKLAAETDTPLTFYYTDADGDASTRTVCPSEVKESNGKTLIVGTVAPDEIRSFRVDRIDGAVKSFAYDHG